MSGTMAPPLELRFRGGSLAEAMTLLAVLREHVILEVTDGEQYQSFLLVRGLFVGSAETLACLRGLLSAKATVEVKFVSSDTLAGLYGLSVSVMALVLDPDGRLSE